MSGEILYLGQQKDSKYELEAEKLPLANRAYIAEETDKEEKAREEETIKKQEALQKEYKEIKAKEARLKKEIEAGKHNIKTPEETQKIADNRKAIIVEVETVARAYKVNTWGEIVDVGERHKVFPKGLMTSQIKTIIVDHPDKCEALKVAIKEDQEIADEDIPF